MKKSRAYMLSAFAALLTACSHTSDQANNVLKESTAWVLNAADWAEEAEAVYADATDYVGQVSKVKAEGSWGVILDVDETVLNNVEYQASRDRIGATYTEESWHQWTQREAATLVPGAAQFIRYVNQKGGHVVLVTNRRDTEQFATESNLAKLGLRRHDDFRVLLTRALPNGPGNKDARFELAPIMLSAQGFPDVEIAAYVGDGKGDKPSKAGDWRFFCVDQGAMYGDPCADVPGPGR